MVLILSELKLRLSDQENKRFDVNISSLFHGFIFELLQEKEGDLLHRDGLKPYRQSIRFLPGEIEWTITTLDESAFEMLIKPLMKTEEITLKHKGVTLSVKDKVLTTLSYEQLIEETYFKEVSPFIHVHFNTPTAFKTQGQYQNYPDLRLIYQSAMKKFDTVVTSMKLFDEEVLDHLVSHSKIIGYNLKSTFFYVEKVKIPSYVGCINIKIEGPQALAQLARLLLRFGEYSGIGIKCTLGMGSVSVNTGMKGRGE